MIKACEKERQNLFQKPLGTNNPSMEAHMAVSLIRLPDSLHGKSRRLLTPCAFDNSRQLKRCMENARIDCTRVCQLELRKTLQCFAVSGAHYSIHCQGVLSALDNCFERAVITNKDIRNQQRQG